LRIGKRERDAHLRQIMATPQGRSIVAMFLTGFAASTCNTNPQLAAWAEGRRSRAAEVRAELMKLCPQQTLQLELENPQE
jgi:hypothetical protein